jgi:hypothetical protein
MFSQLLGTIAASAVVVHRERDDREGFDRW